MPARPRPAPCVSGAPGHRRARLATATSAIVLASVLASFLAAQEARAIVRVLGEGEVSAGGPWDAARAGDFLLESGRARFVVEAPEHPHGIAATGGQLIDASETGPASQDALGLLLLLLSDSPLDGVAYDTLYSVGDGDFAGVRARGRWLRHRSIEVRTDYALSAVGDAIEIVTSFHNTGKSAREIAPVERIHLGGTSVAHTGPVSDLGVFASGPSQARFTGAVLASQNVIYTYRTTEASSGRVELLPTLDDARLDAVHSPVSIGPGQEFTWRRELRVGDPLGIDVTTLVRGRAPDGVDLAPAVRAADLALPPGFASIDTRVLSAASLGPGGAPEVLVQAASAAALDAVVIADRNTITSIERAPGPIAFSGLVSDVPGVGRFLALPASPRPWENRRGAPSTVGATPEYLFPALRKLDDRAMVVVIAGRDDENGYFNRMRVDPASGRSRHVEYNTSFDAIEILSGRTPRQFETLLFDWFHLLNQGRRVVATGASGCEGMNGPEIGSVRTIVDLRSRSPLSPATGFADAGEDRGVDVLAALLREGRAIVSSGLVVMPLVDNRWGPGDFVTGEAGALIRLAPTTTVEVTVSGPAWAPCDSIELFANGRVAASAWIHPDERHRAGEKSRVVFELPIREDTWIVAVARGGPYTEAVFPRAVARGLYPIGVSNAVIVDTDGDGELPKRF